MSVAQNNSLISYSFPRQWLRPAQVFSAASPRPFKVRSHDHSPCTCGCTALDLTPVRERTSVVVGTFQSSPQLGLYRHHQPAHHSDIFSYPVYALGIHVFPQDHMQALWSFPSRRLHAIPPCPRFQRATCIHAHSPVHELGRAP
jgi:hypothetical protein